MHASVLLALALAVTPVWAHLTPQERVAVERVHEGIHALLGAEDDREDTQKPDPKPDTGKAEWECYLDRYDDLRLHKASGRRLPYTEAWADTHYSRWGKAEGRTWGCQEASEDDDGAISDRKPWNHSNQSGSFGTSVNLCSQYDAESVDLDGNPWRYHRRDKGRQVWHDPKQRDGLHGTITVRLRDGRVIRAELEPGRGIKRSGDC